MRNAALGKEDKYHSNSHDRMEFYARDRIRELVGTIPILTKPIAGRTATKQIAINPMALGAPIYAKIKTTGAMTMPDPI